MEMLPPPKKKCPMHERIAIWKNIFCARLSADTLPLLSGWEPPLLSARGTRHTLGWLPFTVVYGGASANASKWNLVMVVFILDASNVKGICVLASSVDWAPHIKVCGTPACWEWRTWHPPVENAVVPSQLCNARTHCNLEKYSASVNAVPSLSAWYPLSRRGLHALWAGEPPPHRGVTAYLYLRRISTRIAGSFCSIRDEFQFQFQFITRVSFVAHFSFRLAGTGFSTAVPPPTRRRSRSADRKVRSTTTHKRRTGKWRNVTSACDVMKAGFTPGDFTAYLLAALRSCSMWRNQEPVWPKMTMVLPKRTEIGATNPFCKTNGWPKRFCGFGSHFRFGQMEQPHL